MRAAPAVSRANMHKQKAHTSIQVQRKQSGIPCAMALRLMPCSPRRRIRLVTVAAGLMADRPGWIELATDSLAPATGVGTTRFCRTQQPVFARPPSSEGGLRRVKRLRRARRRSSCAPRTAHGSMIRPAISLRTNAAASTASQPAFVTTRDPPLLPGWDGASW